MKAIRLFSALPLIFAIAVHLPAQQADADHKRFEEVKAKAEAGAASAQHDLGVCYESGEGVDKDTAESLKWYRKAAEQGEARSQNKLGRCFIEGNGVRKDFAQAVDWFRKAAAQGFVNAQHNLGLCYAQGDGVSKDMAEAVKWWRMASEQGFNKSQQNLALSYARGDGVSKNMAEAAKLWRKASDQGNASAQHNLGVCYANGTGVRKDKVEAVKWYRSAALQNYPSAQYNLGLCYAQADGVSKDMAEAVKWLRKAADQGVGGAQCSLGLCCARGDGVVKDFVEAHKWFNLAAAQGSELAKQSLPDIERDMTRKQMAEAQRLAHEFRPRKALEPDAIVLNEDVTTSSPSGSGTGFIITEDGFFITNEHVVRDAAQVRLVTSTGLISAKVVKVDAANDLALLKAEGKFSALPVAASRAVKLGGTVATVGFPNIGLQGFAPKLAKGEIASLAGAADDARYFQISVPVQPGNSGGALVDERGNVVGVVSAKLNAAAALKSSGALPENVNYAIKSSYLLSFLESVPEVSAKLKEPETKERKFEDVVKSAEQAAVLVLVY